MPTTIITASGITFPDSTTQTTAAASAFESGTLAFFQQTSAPTGWTKSTSHNDKMLRCVSGTCSSGGSVAFSSCMTSRTPSGNIATTKSVGNTTLSINQYPSHSHTVNRNYNTGNQCSTRMTRWADKTSNPGSAGPYDGMNNTGGSAAHNHGINANAAFSGNALNLAVQYVDFILASKD